MIGFEIGKIGKASADGAGAFLYEYQFYMPDLDTLHNSLIKKFYSGDIIYVSTRKTFSGQFF